MKGNISEKIISSTQYINEENYWLNHLAGGLDKSTFPADFKKTGEYKNISDNITFTVPHEIYSKIMGITKGSDSKIYMILTAGLVGLLDKYSFEKNKDIIIGAPIYKQEIEGEFINTVLALKNRVAENKSFKELLQQVRQTIIDANNNANYPIETLLYQLGLPFPADDFPLFAVAILLKNIHDRNHLNHINLHVIFSFLKNDEHLEGTVEYNTFLFEKTTIHRIINHYLQLLREVLFNPDSLMSRVEIYWEQEKQQVLFGFNRTGSTIPDHHPDPQAENQTIDKLFEQQAGKITANTAVVYEDQHITYGFMNERVNSLAAFLRCKGVTRGNLVAIMVSPSLEMITGMLAIMKAGAAYLPIDPAYPDTRKKFMIEDSRAHLLITQIDLIHQNSAFPETLSKEHIIDLKNEGIYRDNTGNIPCHHTPEDLIYVIYTSGTTGQPKGVLIRHKGFVNLVNVHRQIFTENYQSRMSQAASISFDAMAFETWPCLVNGACLYIAGNAIRIDPAKMKEWLIRHEITHSFQSTMMFERLLREEWTGPGVPGTALKALRTAGDKLKHVPVRSYPFRLYNLYGPTEDTVWTTCTEVKPGTVQEKEPSIGKPLGNHHIYILDTFMHPQVIGIPGELCISGIGLARGYLNHPELTSEKFADLCNLAASNEMFLRGVQGGSFYKKRPPGRRRQKLYQTGDLARWLEDSNIEFLGRIDTQVKIRGFRIELSEVENKLLAHPQIKEAVVIARKMSDTSTSASTGSEPEEPLALCAYVVAAEELPVLALREYLSSEMPDYMIPAYFVQLDTIPLTSSGKIDRKNLPVPKIEAGKDYVPPRDEIEKKLVNIWSDLLGINENQISIRDNFFHLGGHSLKATLLTARINKELDVSVPLAEIFKTPTLKELASYIKKEAPQYQYISIKPSEAKEYYPLSSAQKRLYVLQQMDPENTGYNIPSLMTLTGELHREKFAGIFKQIIHRHEGLRTSFIIADEQPVQKIHKHVEFEIEYKTAAGIGIENRVPATDSRPFDLSQPPLMRVILQELGKNHHLLIVEMHHIISDGTSIGVMVNEFMSLFCGRDLAVPKIHYKDFSQWQESRQIKETILRQEEYWLNEFPNEIPVLDLPVDFPRPLVQSFAGSNYNFEIDETEIKALNRIAQSQGATFFIILLSIYTVFLSKITGQEDIIVGTPTAGRRHHELESLIGMFVNTLVLRNSPHAEKPFIRFLHEVKDRTLKAFENQEYPFEQMVEKIQVNRDTSRNPLFDTMLVLQNFDIPEIKIPGLELRPFIHENKTAKFDLTLYVSELEGKQNFTFEYCTKLFKAETITRFAGYLKRIISRLAKRPEERLAELEIISGQEKRQILFIFNNTACQFPHTMTLQFLFEKQVEYTAQRTALIGPASNPGPDNARRKNIHEIVHLTYNALNEQSNQMAHRLREKGARADKIIGIMMERSIEMIIAMFAVIKAGGAYLPIDPDYPPDRIRYLIKDSNAVILLTNRSIPGEPIEGLETVKVNIAKGKSRSHRGENLCGYGTHSNLAYVIYTSGSTGRPKGVLIDHPSVVNRLNWMQKKYRIDVKDTLLQKTPVTFDVSIWELFWWSITGARLSILIPGGEKSPAAIIDNIEKNSVTVVHFVPSMLSIFLQYIKDSRQMKRLAGLNRVIASGEALTVNQVEEFHNLLYREHQTRLTNLYGPTEATVDVSYFDCPAEENLQKIPIGKPLDNIKLVIISQTHHLQPAGITGQLCILGVGLARGYLNRPQLTSEKFKFIDRNVFPGLEGLSVFEDDTYRRFYYTGDLARWLPEGNIEFLGRIDHQVKIRGFRIELEEIENRLLSHPEIKEAVVISKQDKNQDKCLCAYIITQQDVHLPVPELREFLAGYLPGYMIPAYFVTMQKFPLTPSGKTNVRALPEPEIQNESRHTAPRDPLEIKLAGLWSDVLAVEKTRIGLESNFFAIGGHSLKATLLTLRIHKELDVNVPLLQVFKTPTLKGLAQYIKLEAAPHRYIPLEPVEKKEYYKLSPAQKRIYLLQQMDPQSTVYNIPSVMILAGPFHLETFEETLGKMIRRHESFRTCFARVNGEPVQRIRHNVPFQVEHYHLPHIDYQSPLSHGEKFHREELHPEISYKLPENIPAETGSHYSSFITGHFIRPFDLAQAPLLRVGLIKENNGNYLLLVDMHHIIADGFSARVLTRDFLNAYNNENLPPQKIRYIDFSHWQKNNRQEEILFRQQAFWLEEFAAETTALNLPLDFPRPSIQDFSGSTVYFTLDMQEIRALKLLARKQDVTLFMVLFSIFNIFLSTLSSQDDIVVGTPIAGRRHPDLENVIGMCVNTLALRNFLDMDETFTGFLYRLKEKTLQAFENQEYQFEDLVEKIEPERDLSRNPLFDTMFILQNLADTLGPETRDEKKNVTLTPIAYENKTAKFDLTLSVVEQEDNLDLVFEYGTKLFKKDTIIRFINYFKKIVSTVTGNPGIKLSAIEIITSQEKQQLLVDFNNTRTAYPRHKTMIELFEIQAEKSPDRISALSLENAVSITYRELSRRAGQLAGVLREQGAAADQPVGILMERCLEMVIAVLGILNAGCAYLPINPEYPEDRIQYIIADSSTNILITCQSLEKKAKEIKTNLKILSIDSSKLSVFSSSGPSPSHPGKLAYIIYTSGSTGKPKGVMVEQCSVLNVLTALQAKYPLSPSDTYLLKTSFVFDVSVTEFFGWFPGGGRLAILEKNGEKDPGKILETIEKACITHINFVPAMFNAFIEALNPSKAVSFSSLRYIFLAGEALSPGLVHKFRQINRNIQLENLYGPTEATVYASQYSLSRQENNEIIPIGKPLPSYRLYILSNHLHLQPIGVTGELYISGSGTARGYLNNPALTREKFLPNPFSCPSGDKMYRTGDLARWLADGNIEFKGRIDLQVKIRGFRIEPGEIENQLKLHPHVKEAVVLVKEEKHGDKYLCTYFVPLNTASADSLDQFQLKAYLSGKLPDYMIPLHFISIEEIPLNANGKLDRKALPEPDRITPDTGYQAPKNHIEKRLADIWSELLNIPIGTIGRNSHFFALGGHSLKAAIMISRIHKIFNIDIPLAEIFKNPLLKQMAALISGPVTHEFTSIEPVEKKEYYSLSPAQKRLYILQQLDQSGTVYNIPSVMIVEGALNREKCAQILQTLIRRHESLRTSFAMPAGEPVQRIHDAVAFNLDFYDVQDLHHTNADDCVKQFIRPFDLSAAPLFRVGLAKTKKKDTHIFMIDMHHIISDGTSAGVFFNEFMSLYSNKGLQEPRIHYKDVSQWQTSEKMKAVAGQQESYWLKEFSGEIPVLHILTDYPRPDVQRFEGNRLRFEIDEKETLALSRMARTQGATLFMVLLAIYNIFLAKISCQEDIIVGTPSAGRRHADLESIIGMFVNTLALRNYPHGSLRFNKFLESVKEKTLLAFENQDYPFEDLVGKAAVERDTSRNPLFDAMLILQNMFDPSGYVAKTANTEINGLKITPYDYENQTAKFDLTLITVEEQGRLCCLFDYCTKLFKIETISRFVTYFENIISTVTENPGINISHIDIITGEEKKQLLHDFNRTEVEYPGEKTVHQLFALQVEHTPHHIALIGAVPGIPAEDPLSGNRLPESEKHLQKRPMDNMFLTYHELNQRSENLCSRLKEKGLRPGTIIALFSGRTLGTLIGILGILKAHAAYLPIPRLYPQDRIKYMLADSNVNMSVNDNQDITVFHEVNKTYPDNELPSAIEYPPLSPAYVIYTSGSTGKPKGVIIQHNSLANFIKGMTDIIDFKTTDKILCLTDISFDIFGLETLTALTRGSTIIMGTTKQQIEPAAALHAFTREKTTIFQATPSRVQLLLAYDRPEAINCISILRYLLVGGEEFPRDLLAQLQPVLTGTDVILFNLYGPTETTIWSSAKNLTGFSGLSPNSNSDMTRITIGNPIANTRIFILDIFLKLVPRGVPGEICIAGHGLAPGYLNRPELSAEKFCLWQPGGTLFEKTAPPGLPRKNFLLKYLHVYRTGDLGRWLNNGEIEFLGRVDFQVKIRGHRIELKEIENCLLNYLTINKTVVTGCQNDSGDKFLVAYYVSDNSLKTQELIEFLGNHLPAYMIPSYFVRLEDIPLTPNGKVNRKALPKPDIDKSNDYTAPRFEIEKKLAKIWSDVLGIQQNKISINDNFFYLGGHSLKAALLVSHIHKELNVRVPLPEIFKNTQIRSLAAYIKESIKENYFSLQPTEKKDYYPLSPTQNRLYILQQLDPESTVYNIPTTMKLTGPLRVEKCQQTLIEIIHRHESLRTSFNVVNGNPVQHIHDKIEFQPEFLDLQVFRDLNDCVKSIIRPFDLSKAPLLRVGVIKTNTETDHFLIVDVHHIISDGTSTGIFFNEFMSLYNGQCLIMQRIHYKDFSQWQNNTRIKDVINLQEFYWLEEFNGEIPVLDIMTDFPRPPLQNFEGNCLQFELDKEQTQALKQIAWAENATLFMVLLAVFTIFLSKMSSQEDIVVGTPVAGRRHADLETIIGMFINTLPLRNFPHGREPFNCFLHTVKKKTLNAFENQEFPFEDLVEKVAVTRDLSRNPLFDVMLVLQNMFDPSIHNSQSAPSSSTGLQLTPYVSDIETVKFDLVLNAIEENGRLYFSFDYCTKLFKKNTIIKFINHLKKVFSSIIEHPGKRISEIEIITAEEKRQLLTEFNGPTVEYPFNKTIYQLFAQQVNRSPDHIALLGSKLPITNKNQTNTLPEHEDTASQMHLSYQELKQKSQYLAGVLKKKGAQSGIIVGLMMSRTPEMMIALLGILQAGAAYLPISLEYPEDRINYILDDSKVKLLVTENTIFHDHGDEKRIDVIFIDDPAVFSSSSSTSSSASSSHLLNFSTSYSSNLAYVIYTSGSTGRPKGVMIRHDSLVNFTTGMTDLIDFKETDRVLCLTDISFDIFGLETLTPLTCGSAIIMGTRQQQVEPAAALQAFWKEKTTIFQSTPSRLQLFFTYNRDETIKSLLELRYLLVGGEAFPRELLEQLNPVLEENRLILYNLYGPTETTIWSGAKRLTGLASITIGKPIANTDIFILDKYLHLVPLGVAGEICISGLGLAPGYLNRPELTGEKFIPVPYFNRKPMRQYFTGDLGRWLPDGEIEFLGRKDFQVKIRGHRIELAEIENCLLTGNEISEAIVIDRQNSTGEKFLAAYIVSEKPFNTQELMEHLGRKLPAYMIPSYFIRLDHIPLTVSGKVNRIALPEPANHELSTGNPYCPPETEEEKIITSIWSEFLSIDEDKIGIHDNFFTIGGHSLQAVRVIARLRELFNLEVSLRLLFENPTVHRLANAVVRMQLETIGKQDIEQILMQLKDMTDQEAELFLSQMDD